MKKFDISVEALQKSLDGKVPPEECNDYYQMWETLKQKGDDLLGRLETHISTLENSLSVAFPSIVGATEEWFHSYFYGRSNKNYQNVSPIVVALYDLLLSLKRSYEHKSAISCGIIARAVFEARVNLAEILKSPESNSAQYIKFKQVAKHWNEYRTDVIDQQKLTAILQKYPEWYDTDWKAMKSKRDTWTGIPNDNLKKMTERNNLEDAYNTLYKTTSAFTHVSPLLSNYYSVHGKGPLCKELGVFEISYIALSQYIDAFSDALQIVNLDPEDARVSLSIPLLIAKDVLGH